MWSGAGAPHTPHTVERRRGRVLTFFFLGISRSQDQLSEIIQLGLTLFLVIILNMTVNDIINIIIVIENFHVKNISMINFHSVGPSYTKAGRRVVSVQTSLSLLREICFLENKNISMAGGSGTL